MPDLDSKGDIHASWYNAVHCQCFNNCNILSESNSDGSGRPARNAGSDENGTVENMDSVNAVVTTAFTAAAWAVLLRTSWTQMSSRARRPTNLDVIGRMYVAVI